MTEGHRFPRPSLLEAAAAIHVTALLIGVSWAFGGNASWVRMPISVAATIGILISLAAVARAESRSRIPKGTLGWALPILALNALVLLSCLSPGFKDMAYGGDLFLMPLRMPWWRPSAARPVLALQELWLFDGIYFSCFNLVLLVQSRTLLRAIVAVVVANTLVLSIFGSVQKLVGSTGIYFGSIKSPQDYFFASFVYDNHWASFVILTLAACVGLTLRYVGRGSTGGPFHGPALLGLIVTFLIAITVPLSGARACTLLVCVLMVVALVRGAPKLLHAMRASELPKPVSMLLLALAVGTVTWGAWSIAGDVVQSRVSKARAQLTTIWSQGGLGSRSALYHDTWRMAHDRVLFGWGMGSFPSVFSLYNTQVSPIDRIPVVYHDAHSDWLQCLAELGFAGAILIAAAIIMPAVSLRGERLSSVPYFLLAGCILVGAYALIEFPFGNVAVALAWCLCYACALQYRRLSRPPPRPTPHP